MKKFLISAALVTSVCLSMAFGGCKPKTTVNENGEVVSTDVFVYTNQTSGGRSTQLEALVKKQNFPFEVTFVELAGQNLKSRLINEKNNPFADVVLGGSTAEYLELKDAGVIKPYAPTWLDQIDEVYHEKDNYFSTWAIEPLYLVYNTKYYTKDETKVTSSLKLAPTGWEDLADNFKGKYNVFKPSSTSGTNIYASILAQYRDDTNGIHGVSQEGWDLLAKVINNGILDNGNWQPNLALGKAPIAMAWAGAILEIEDAYECDLDVIVPEEGVPASISQVAIVNTKSEARFNAAKMFVEWWGQAETQVEWSKISGQAPANKAAFELVDPQIKELVNVKLLASDYRFIADHYSNWREKIELDIVK